MSPIGSVLFGGAGGLAGVAVLFLLYWIFRGDLGGVLLNVGLLILSCLLALLAVAI